MSCIALPYPPAVTMLTLSQVSLLVTRTASYSQDDNNNVGCGALALKMLSSRCSAAARAMPRPAPSGPKRCLFGAPSAADTQRLLQEDQEAVKARMQRRWGWDMSREAPSAAPSAWQWQPVKARRHPYAVRLSAPKAAVTPVPAMLSPLAATPTAVMNTSATSSSSGTSTLSSPTSPSPSHLSSPTVLRRPMTPESSWESESDDSCCGDSDGSASPRPHSVPVQTRITDFWRTRRCSTSESIVKTTGSTPSAPARACSVSV